MTPLEINRTNAIFDVLWQWRNEQIAALPAMMQGIAGGFAPDRAAVLAKAKLAMKADDKALKDK